MFEGKAEEAMNFYTSLFVTCEKEEELDNLFEKLFEYGQVLMRLSSTPVSEKFGWVGDSFGVSWQLSLA